MAGMFADLSRTIETFMSDAAECSPYWGFEPFDLSTPTQEVVDKAHEDGVDLLGDTVAQLAGQYPRPFQSGAILSTKPNVCLLAASQVGKALDEQTPVATPKGPVPIGDLAVGDQVFGADGKPHFVTGVFPQGVRECYQFVFDDHRSCVCDEDHLWKWLPFSRRSIMRTSHGVREPNTNYEKYLVDTASRIIERVGEGTISSGKRFATPNAEPLCYEEKRLPIAPYTLGALIGDGSLSMKAVCFTKGKKDSDVLDRVTEETGHIVEWVPTSDGITFRSRGWTKGRNELMEGVRALGLEGKKSRGKFIPALYLQSSVEQRTDLLRGLMDTDGYVDDKCCMEYSTMSRQLADDFQDLVRGLGGKCKIRLKKAVCKKPDGTHVDCGLGYRCIPKFSSLNPFWLKRKADKFYEIRHKPWHVIQEIHKVASRRTCCISVDSPDSLFVLANGIVTHNTHAAQALVGSCVSRQPPFSLRYEKGIDTGIKRQISPLNINRFGRIDVRTGTVIDHNIHAQIDLQSWNCGNIIGAGIFPEELYVPDGKQLWVGTLAGSIDTHWWPILAGTGEQRFLPAEFLDKSQGNDGTNSKKRCIHCPNDVTLFVKSYDADFKTFETVTAHVIVYDEEPLKVGHYLSGEGHSVYQRFFFTALNGLSFTQSLFFGCIDEAARNRAKEHDVGVYDREDFDFFQASRYDSPYVDPAAREIHRKSQPRHGRVQKVWGRYGEHTGNPFFDRSKLEYWRERFCAPHRKVRLSPKSPYDGIIQEYGRTLPCLMDVGITETKATEDDLRTVFRVYENPKKGVGYLWLTDAAEGATDPKESQDFNFGIMVRAPTSDDKFENIAHYDYPVVVATIRSTLPVIAYAKYTALALRWYNNAVLAPERGHGKDNEAYGQTLDDWPYWYYRNATNDTTQNSRPKKGFDTNAGTRDPMLSMVREWLDEFEKDEDPLIKDSWLYDELAGAVLKETRNGKKRCDHPRSGYLDGVICLAIATYIFNESPDVIVCNYVEPEKRSGQTFLERMQKRNSQDHNLTPVHMGVGVGKISGNVYSQRIS